MLACVRLLSGYAQPYDLPEDAKREQREDEDSDEYDSEEERKSFYRRDNQIQMAEDMFPMLDT